MIIGTGLALLSLSACGSIQDEFNDDWDDDSWHGSDWDSQTDDDVVRYMGGVTSEPAMDEIRIVKALIEVSRKGIPTVRPATPSSNHSLPRPNANTAPIVIRETGLPCSQLNSRQSAYLSSGDYSTIGSYDPQSAGYKMDLTFNQCAYAAELDEAGTHCNLQYEIGGSIKCEGNLNSLNQTVGCRTHSPCYTANFTIEGKRWLVGQNLTFTSQIDPRTGLGSVSGEVCINGKVINVEDVISGALERRIEPITQCGDPS